MLEECINAVKFHNAEWCITDIIRIENNKKEIKVSNIPSNNYLRNILKEYFIRIAPFYYKRSLMEIGLYDESFFVLEDWDLNTRMIEDDKKFIYINKPLYAYKIRKKSLIKNNTKNVLDFTLKFLQKHRNKLLGTKDRDIIDIYSQHMWNLARRYFYELKDIKKSIYCIKESLKYSFNLNRLIHPLFFNIKRIIRK